MKRSRQGFTIIEVLVTIAIIGILAGVLYINFSESSAGSRDIKRQADLRAVQAALELYKKDHGRYPAACNGSNPMVWSGEQGTNYGCLNNSHTYIVAFPGGADFVPDYMKRLPTDPKPGSGDYGYAYIVNAQGTVYKFMSRNTIEHPDNQHGVSDYSSEFRPCDVVYYQPANTIAVPDKDFTSLPEEGINGNCNNNTNPGGNACYSLGSCNRIKTPGAVNTYSPLPVNVVNFRCVHNNDATKKTYAVWGGYGDPSDPTTTVLINAVNGAALNSEQKVEILTEQVICRMP